MLSSTQFGFRKKRNTELAATLLLDKIRENTDEGFPQSTRRFQKNQLHNIQHGLDTELERIFTKKDQRDSFEDT